MLENGENYRIFLGSGGEGLLGRELANDIDCGVRSVNHGWEPICGVFGQVQRVWKALIYWYSIPIWLSKTLAISCCESMKARTRRTRPSGKARRMCCWIESMFAR